MLCNSLADTAADDPASNAYSVYLQTATSGWGIKGWVSSFGADGFTMSWKQLGGGTDDLGWVYYAAFGDQASGASDASAVPGFVYLSTQVFRASATWTKPEGCTAALVVATGSGGNGRARSNGSDRPAGGSAGGTAIKFVTKLGTTEAVEVGDGDTSSSELTQPSREGKASKFGEHCSAGGGGAGKNNAGADAPGVGVGGDVNMRGGWGVRGSSDSTGTSGGASYWGGGGGYGAGDKPGALGSGGADADGNGMLGKGVVVVHAYGDVPARAAETSSAVKLAVKSGHFTKLCTGAGSQKIEGVGFKPKFVLFFAGVHDLRTRTWGQDDGVTPQQMYFSWSEPGMTNTPNSACFSSGGCAYSVYLQAATAGAGVKGRIASMDADGFTLAWTQIGAGADKTARIYYTAFGEESAGAQGAGAGAASGVVNGEAQATDSNLGVFTATPGTLMHMPGLTNQFASPGLKGLHIKQGADGTGDRGLILEGSGRPTMLFVNAHEDANHRVWEIMLEKSSGDLIFRSLNDDLGLKKEVLRLHHNGGATVDKDLNTYQYLGEATNYWANQGRRLGEAERESIEELRATVEEMQRTIDKLMKAKIENDPSDVN